MRRLSAAIVVALLAVGLFAPASFAASATNTKAVPKVVFVVGPAGAATNGYRSQARAAAAIARKYTPDVIELYSPNATWPAVREALQGASLVVYMGHGNGWPSKYRDALYPPTQNGFGLNPKAGGGDYTHQYFGEASVGGQVKLARNAVVLLNHLCYASGNTEPGLPEGSLVQAKQRVDNYAAGFIRAGAAGRHRRGVVEPVVLRQDDPVGQPLDPERLVERPEREPQPPRVQERAQRRLRRADGHRDRDVRVHPLGGDEDRPGLAGRPRRRGGLPA